jgi:hypothetical protein
MTTVAISSPGPEGHGKNHFVTYEVKIKTNNPALKSYVKKIGRRRYEEFAWLQSRLVAENQINATLTQIIRQWQAREGITESVFIEEQQAELQRFMDTVVGDDQALNSRAMKVFLSNSPSECKYCENFNNMPSKTIVHTESVPLNVRFHCRFCATSCSSHDALQIHENRHSDNVVETCGTCQKKFKTEADANRHCHWTCPLCKAEITIKDNIPGHEAQHADFGNKYSIALEKAINGDAKVLDDGKKLKEEAEREFGPVKNREKTDRYCYSLFVALVLVSVVAFIESKVYEGKGTDDRELQHKLNGPRELSPDLQLLYAKAREEGTVLLSHRFETGLTGELSSLYESAKLATLGFWNLKNKNNGERTFESLNWDRNQLATLGSYLIYCEYNDYTKLQARKFEFKKINLDEGTSGNTSKQNRVIPLQLPERMTVGEFRALVRGRSDTEELSISLTPNHLGEQQELQLDEQATPAKRQKT